MADCLGAEGLQTGQEALYGRPPHDAVEGL